MTPVQAVVAIRVAGRFPRNHETPTHVGDPGAIGANLHARLFGGPATDLPPGLIPVFWACGVTPQETALAARLPLMMTHAPGHTFISDLEADRLSHF